MSLLLDALYKASKDKEKVNELALEPRHEEILPPEQNLPQQTLSAPVSETVVVTQELHLELPEPFIPAPLPEPKIQVAAKATSATPFPNLELELEPRAEDVKKDAAVAMELEVVSRSLPALEPEPEPFRPQTLELASQNNSEKVVSHVVEEQASQQPEQSEPEPAEPEKIQPETIQPEPVKSMASQAIKQPGKIAQILSRSKIAKKSSTQRNKRTLVLGGVAGIMLLAMGAMFWYESSHSVGVVPLAVVDSVPVHSEVAQPVVQEEIVQTETTVVSAAVSDLEIPALQTPSGETNSAKTKQNSKKWTDKAVTDIVVLPDAETIKEKTAPASDNSGEQASRPKRTRQGNVTATVKPNNLAIAYAALLEGRLEEASQSYAKVLQTNAQEPNALLGLATIAHQRGQREDALDYYQRVLRQDPGNVTAAAAVLALDTRLDSNTASLKARDLAERQPDSVAALTAAANTLVRDGMVAEAAPLFARAQRLEPENPLHVYNYAVALDRLGQVEQAIELYKKVVKMAENALPTSVRPFSLEVVKLRLAELRQSLTVTSDNQK